MPLTMEKNLRLGSMAAENPNTMLSVAAYAIYYDSVNSPFETTLKIIPVLINEVFNHGN